MRMLVNSCILEAVTGCFLGSEFSLWLVDSRKTGYRRRDQSPQERLSSRTEMRVL